MTLAVVLHHGRCRDWGERGRILSHYISCLFENKFSTPIYRHEFHRTNVTLFFQDMTNFLVECLILDVSSKNYMTHQLECLPISSRSFNFFLIYHFLAMGAFPLSRACCKWKCTPPELVCLAALGSLHHMVIALGQGAFRNFLIQPCSGKNCSQFSGWQAQLRLRSKFFFFFTARGTNKGRKKLQQREAAELFSDLDKMFYHIFLVGAIH